jgi:hypothetical protein
MNISQAQQQRLAPGPSVGYPPGRGQPVTPLVRGYSTPVSTPGYSSPSVPMYSGGNPTYRGVGRPRKYDVR